MGAQEYEVGEKVGIRCGYVKFQAFVTIERKFRQRLGDMTEKDAHEEGFKDLDAFKAFWLKIYKRWNSDEVVWVYIPTKVSEDTAFPFRIGMPCLVEIDTEKRCLNVKLISEEEAVKLGWQRRKRRK